VKQFRFHGQFFWQDSQFCKQNNIHTYSFVAWIEKRTPQMIKFSATLLATLIAASVQAATVDLRILETTDLHSNMMDFDYYKDAPTEKFGLVRTASLINAARGEVKNSVLVDNGDLIQGSPLGDYMAAKGLKKGDIHPVYKALNTLE